MEGSSDENKRPRVEETESQENVSTDSPSDVSGLIQPNISTPSQSEPGKTTQPGVPMLAQPVIHPAPLPNPPRPAHSVFGKTSQPTTPTSAKSVIRKTAPLVMEVSCIVQAKGTVVISLREDAVAPVCSKVGKEANEPHAAA